MGRDSTTDRSDRPCSSTVPPSYPTTGESTKPATSTNSQAPQLYNGAVMNSHTGQGDQLSASKDLSCPLTRMSHCPWTDRTHYNEAGDLVGSPPLARRAHGPPPDRERPDRFTSARAESTREPSRTCPTMTVHRRSRSRAESTYPAPPPRWTTSVHLRSRREHVGPGPYMPRTSGSPPLAQRAHADDGVRDRPDGPPPLAQRARRLLQVGVDHLRSTSARAESTRSPWLTRAPPPLARRAPPTAVLTAFPRRFTSARAESTHS